MNSKGPKGKGVEYICPSCGYKTTGAKEPTNPATLMPMSETLVPPAMITEEPVPVEEKIESHKAERSSSVSKSKRGKRASKINYSFAEWDAEISKIANQLEELEKDFSKELQIVRVRLAELTKDIRKAEKSE